MDHKPDNYYQNTRPEVMAFIPKGLKTALEIGCGEGKFGECIKQDLGAEVWGVEPVKDYAGRAAKILDKVITAGVEEAVPSLPRNKFDLIIANDVLEHLVDPYKVLASLKRVLKPRGFVVSSIPNMRNFHVFYGLARHKKWEYQESGILDRTHLRFFTTDSIRDMYETHGYEVVTHEGINEENNLPKWFHAINYCTRGRLDDMKYVQFATVARLK